LKLLYLNSQYGNYLILAECSCTTSVRISFKWICSPKSSLTAEATWFQTG